MFLYVTLGALAVLMLVITPTLILLESRESDNESNVNDDSTEKSFGVFTHPVAASNMYWSGDNILKLILFNWIGTVLVWILCALSFFSLVCSHTFFVVVFAYSDIESLKDGVIVFIFCIMAFIAIGIAVMVPNYIGRIVIESDDENKVDRLRDIYLISYLCSLVVVVILTLVYPEMPYFVNL